LLARYYLSPDTVKQARTLVPYRAEIVFIEWNFCTEYDTNDINNIKRIANKTLLVTPYGCSRSTKLDNLLKVQGYISGVILRAFAPGLEVYVEPAHFETSKIFYLSVDYNDFNTFKQYLTASPTSPLIVILTADYNPFDEVFLDRGATFGFLAVFATCFFLVLIFTIRLLLLHLKVKYQNKGGVRKFRLNVAHIVLSLQVVSNLSLFLYNVIDPLFFRDILPQAGVIFVFLSFGCTQASIICYQFYWRKLTIKLARIVHFDSHTFILPHIAIKVIASINLVLIVFFDCYIYAIIMVPPSQELDANGAGFLSVLIPFLFFTACLFIVIIANGIRIYRVTKGSQSISEKRTHKIAGLMVTSALGMVAVMIITGLFFDYTYKDAWIFYTLGVVGECGMIATNVSQVLSFVAPAVKPRSNTLTRRKTIIFWTPMAQCWTI
jgi:hypothetical protein